MLKNLFSQRMRKRKRKSFYSNFEGMVQWDVWRNESRHGTYYRFSLGRRRRGLVNSYSPSDLLDFPRMISDLVSFFEEQNAVPEELQRQLNWLADHVDFDMRQKFREWQPYLKALDGKETN